MLQYVIKTLITAVVIVAVSEVSKRSTMVASVLVSLPLTSILAFVWIYYESGDKEKIIAMSQEIVWLVIPSILFFLALPWLLKSGMSFGWALLAACAAMSAAYGFFIWLKNSLPV